ncbi:hypothetical protein M0812_01268 [Anaeramoeba flamelloides]|uniref:Uncharacterized protein n=1 Tax=Anaeramoeba flamelloides TaxID=1746091 RepID=A0AAV8A4V0_9EUKA|nr:hypothetical protein M0812_01268 [Anaeramoeba flamelloides]
MKVVYSIQKPKRNLEKSPFHISAVCCVSSDGSSLPTLIISKLKTIPIKLILQNHLVQLDFVQSNSRFIDRDIYHLWMLKTFIPFLEKTRNRINSNHPALLTLDDVMQVAFTFKNIIFAFKHTGIYSLNPEKTGFSLKINNKSSVSTPSKRIHLRGTKLTQPEIVEKLKQREEKQTKKRIRHNQDN